jgi:transcriptional regulator with XRE-family HTH domain
MTGPELQARRKAAGVTQAQLAAWLGWGRPRVAQVEAYAVVRDQQAIQYLAALMNAERAPKEPVTAA